VTLVNASPFFAERIRAHERAAGAEPAPRELARMVRGTGIDLVVARVTGIDAASNAIEISEGNTTRSLGYDHLVYALGSEAHPDAIPGAVEHALTLGSMEDGAAIDARLRRGVRRLTIVGGGLTAVELATELAERRPELELVIATRGDLVPGFSDEARSYTRESLTGLGVSILEHTAVRAIEPGAIVMDGGKMHTELAVIAAGFRPRRLAAQSGLAVTSSGALAVDASLRSLSAQNVWGAGDAAAIACGEPWLRMACATAMPLGAHAADSIGRVLAGRSPEAFRFGFVAQCMSVGRRRGVVQRVHSDDAARPSFLRGKVGARVKEMVCRFTVAALAIERLFPGTYTWPKANAIGSVAAPVLA
jgi:NADH dehydrogenase FAD-containing subunit